MIPLPTRREHESVEVDCGPHTGFVVRVGFHPITGAPCEVFFDQRGKSGTEINYILTELGIAASKLMQGRAAVAIPPRASWWKRLCAALRGVAAW